MDNIIVYSMEGCPFCVKAKSFLTEKGIGFSEVEISPGSEEWKEMKEKTGSSFPPQILVRDEPIGGYSDFVNLYTTGKLNKMLGLAEVLISPLYDVIIIGGGPAGLSAAIYTARKVLKTMLVSKNLGGQVADTYEIENFLGFSQIETADLIAKFDEHVEKYGIEKLVGIEVDTLDLTGKRKKVTASNGETYLSKTVIIATGKHPRPLNVPGEKELIGKGVAYCSTCDAPLFAGADVAVIGGGNAALEAVIDLAKIAKKVYLISRSTLKGDQIISEKATKLSNVSLFEKYKTNKIMGSQSVEGLEIESRATGEATRIDVEGVFIEIGLLPNSNLVIDTVETNRQGEIVIDDRCRTGISGVFACGDVTNVPFKQVIIAAGEGAKAALSVSDYLINQR